jgi:aldehyde dehydrogenase (NAD+)|tara:strand:- start:1623 stop:3041 length:1419 start_codon:yes stop_codon:yes gene_type:complete
MNSIAKNYINGNWCISPLEIIPIQNPSTPQQVVGYFHPADAETADSALSAAADSSMLWAQMQIGDRKLLIQSLLDRLTENRGDIAGIITLENGKTIAESYAEVDGAIAEGQFQLDFVANGLVENIGTHEIRHQPLGTVLLITPWNFPLATIIRKLIPALAAGNCAVVKPSEFTPFTAATLFNIIHKVGFPPGVVNLVLGDGPVVVPPIIKHKQLRAVSFTGSNATGNILADLVGSRDVRLQMEMGGSNAVVVLADADLDLAAQGIVSNGFACAGQWCTGTSRAIIEAPVYDNLLEKLDRLAKKIILGNGMDSTTTMGPVISQQRQKAHISTVSTAISEGASLVHGGQKPDLPGYFFPPTILADITSEMSISQEEMFGPIIMAMKAANVDEAIDIANNTPFGLSFSIYTDNMHLAEDTIAKINAGMCHINLPTAYRAPELPVSGWKASGRGIAESGRQASDFFTKPKAIYRIS